MERMLHFGMIAGYRRVELWTLQGRRVLEFLAFHYTQLLKKLRAFMVGFYVEPGLCTYTLCWNRLELLLCQIAHGERISLCIPRCSFISWLAVLNRLSTGARMRLWGGHQVCVFCGEGDETRDHLFFACPYSYTIWSSIAGKLLRHLLNPDGEETVASIQSQTKDKLRDILVRLSFQATLYSIWRERNARIHNNGGLTGPQLTRNIEKLMIRNRITSLDYSTKPHLRLLMQRWIMVRP
ncbi:unnamed protein product [Arabidopsis halleri]